MGLFRRTPKGKHALGAAVTSIPSGPLRVAAPLMAAMQPPPAPSPEPILVEPGEPSVMSSIAELIASGDAWASDLDDFHAMHTSPPDSAPVAHIPSTPAPLPVVEVVPVVQAPRPEQLSGRASLEAALADLLPQQEPTPEAYAPPVPSRVQLGFRDGTSASLDPESEQALALELLAQSLTRRD